MRSSLRTHSSLFLIVGLAAACGGGNDNAGSGGASSATSTAASTGTTSSKSSATTTATATSTTGSNTTASTASGTASSSTGVQAMGDPCRGVALPASQVYVPSGMCAVQVANGLGGLRQITFAPNGDLFGVTAGGSIMLLQDGNADGVYASSEMTEYANTGGNGNNCHIDVVGGYLYAGTPDGVKRWPYMPGMTSGGAGEDVVTGQASTGSHPKHTVHVYNGFLYVHSGSAGNMVAPKAPDYDDDRSLVRRFDLSTFVSGSPMDWKSGEVFSAGIRNMVGFKMNSAGRMFGVVNGLDDITYQGQDVHQDNPGEQVLELGMGKNFGYPFCFTAQRVVVNGTVIPAGTQLVNEQLSGSHDDNWCAANSTPPATFFQAHSAPLDIEFFDDDPIGNLPEMYRGGAFAALHGSWDCNNATGYKVVFIPFDGSGDPQLPSSDTMTTTFPYQTVFGGTDGTNPKDGPWSWNDGGSNGENPRPVGLAISPVDGALYIASDNSGVLYRIGIQH